MTQIAIVIILEIIITYCLIGLGIIRVSEFDWGVIRLKYNKRLFPAKYDKMVKPKKVTIFIRF